MWIRMLLLRLASWESCEKNSGEKGGDKKCVETR
jgi:hypothetical protein